MRKLRKTDIAVIGCGLRSQVVVEHLLKESDRQVGIAAVYDPNTVTAENAIARWNMPGTKLCNSADEAVNFPGVEWVMVFSPNACHKDDILRAFNAGKHVFSEKPLATTIDDCKIIFDAHNRSDRFFATGFVLRYSPVYQKAWKILRSGKLGRILSVEANENIPPGHGGYITSNWRRFTKIAGPHILEKCCHDLDLLNWFCDSLPEKVAAFDARCFFTEDNRSLEKKYGKSCFHYWHDPEKTASPFNNENDLQDVFTGIASYRNGIKVSFNYTMSNRIPERRMRFNCTEGTMILDLYQAELRCANLRDEAETVYSFSGSDGHGGGDKYIAHELYRTMSKNIPPQCSGREGLESAVFALAFHQAAREGTVLDLTGIWHYLKR